MKKIDSFEIVKNLRKEDIILRDKKDIYRIVNITDFSVTIYKSDKADSYLTIMPFEDLVSGEWYVFP
ncbi:MAG TPA: hypothetical protein VKR53_20330 [Puia sp.]|nr:hypothetical protein [Puia sp.]